MKIKIDIEDELVNYFRTKVGSNESDEIMLVKMLKLLREILTVANNK